MTSFLFLTLFVLSTVLSQDSCKYYNDENDVTLDLSALEGQQLSFFNEDTPFLDYEYTICTNGIVCNLVGYPQVTGSVVQVYKDPEFCYVPAIYQESVQPEIVTDDDGAPFWSFTYQGSNIGGCDTLGRETNINWFCDIAANDPVVLEAYEDEPCRYVINISYVGACVESPPFECIYQMNLTNSTLDLSSYQDQVFEYYESNGEDHYSFAPCQNSLTCAYTPDGMVNYETFGACYMTAIFDYNIEPIPGKDANGDNMYTFHYTNGIPDNTCTGGRTTLVIWHCDRITLNAKMEAQSLSTCQTQIDMYSRDACGDI